MASKRRIRRKSCEKKRRYESYAQALYHLKKYDEMNSFHLNSRSKVVYPCSFCGGFHIGTPKHKPDPYLPRNKSGRKLHEEMRFTPRFGS